MAFVPRIMPYRTLDGFNVNDAKATDWLADAEIKISYAVLDYSRDARGGRIDPQRLSENLDPTLTLPDPSEVIQSIATRDDPATYLRSFQPDQPQFEALRRKLIELRGADSGSKKAGANNSKIRRDSRQHGALALAAQRPRAVLRQRQRARVHAARGG